MLLTKLTSRWRRDPPEKVEAGSFHVRFQGLTYLYQTVVGGSVHVMARNSRTLKAAHKVTFPHLANFHLRQHLLSRDLMVDPLFWNLVRLP